MEKKRTYSPLGANYEGATDDLAVFANSAKGLCGMLVGDPEAVEELGALLSDPSHLPMNAIHHNHQHAAADRDASVERRSETSAGKDAMGIGVVLRGEFDNNFSFNTGGQRHGADIYV